jgi:hypothetical protein
MCEADLISSTNREKAGYRSRGTKPDRRTDFTDDPEVIARRQGALARIKAAE